MRRRAALKVRYASCHAPSYVSCPCLRSTITWAVRDEKAVVLLMGYLLCCPSVRLSSTIGLLECVYAALSCDCLYCTAGHSQPPLIILPATLSKDKQITAL